MANINEVFPSDYLKADDFGGIEGAPVLAEISHTTIERMKDNTDKICVHLRGYDRGLLLNKTNATTIASYAGPETDDWGGVQVVVYVAMVEYQGKTTEGIRLRQPKVKPAAKPVTPKPAPQGDPRDLDDEASL